MNLKVYLQGVKINYFEHSQGPPSVPYFITGCWVHPEHPASVQNHFFFTFCEYTFKNHTVAAIEAQKMKPLAVSQFRPNLDARGPDSHTFW